MQKTLLIVDDDPIILFSLKEILEHQGYKVYTSDSTNAAFELFCDNDISVVLTDLEMPGDNGDFLCRRIKKLKPETWVCAITGNMAALDQSHNIDAKFDDYIPKPFNIELISKTIDNIFQKQQQQ